VALQVDMHLSNISGAVGRSDNGPVTLKSKDEADRPWARVLYWNEHAYAIQVDQTKPCLHCGCCGSSHLIWRTNPGCIAIRPLLAFADMAAGAKLKHVETDMYVYSSVDFMTTTVAEFLTGRCARASHGTFSKRRRRVWG
jgi:hypothetical protein